MNSASTAKLHNELVAVTAERDALAALCARHGVCTLCGNYYTHHYTEPFATCACNTSEWYNLTEHMLLQQELAKLREQEPAAYEDYWKSDGTGIVRRQPSNGRPLYAAPVPAPAVPKLQVWFGSLPETNGKTNWTAILHRDNFYEGITIARSEYKDRVRYEADRMRWMIGELSEEPDILQCDADMHSGHKQAPAVPAAPAPSVPEEWRKALQEAHDTFQRYADLHRAKDTPDGHEKAKANQKLANKLYALLQSAEVTK